jgi:hypothetical protein
MKKPGRQGVSALIYRVNLGCGDMQPSQIAIRGSGLKGWIDRTIHKESKKSCKDWRRRNLPGVPNAVSIFQVVDFSP